MELHPRKQQPARLSFSAAKKPANGLMTLHFHETSPRTDRVVTLDGLKLDTAPAAEAESPAPQESVTPTP
jgi:hypothetical protein